MIYGYIISATRDDATQLYFAADAPSGGYHYWSTSVMSAQLFPTIASAVEQWAKTLRVESHILHAASGANHAQPDRRVRITVSSLKAGSEQYSENHRFKIKR